ncbi:hypothetical protein CWC25_12250 [Pseudoalteromonas sp. S4389]|uniref:hypothetical protein n=1 Tax=Pseudoalteromonas sp. S4389 TaxID=579556 RepID=UPI0011088042|nr:hypothetical protein [Pseudoalteromonas sp. S4389]TMO43403.1 hypothetical protein CWC25_12250 [Pseudoalteromonas sp. S4389]
MSQLPQDPSLLDIFKERLSNPFLFTYFWVFCSLNWKTILWLLLEPGEISKKLFLLESQHPWDWWTPIWVAAVLVAILPWVNAIVEILKRLAENTTNQLLSKKGWKEMVVPEIHEATKLKNHDLEIQLDRAEARQSKLIEDNQSLSNKLHETSQHNKDLLAIRERDKKNTEESERYIHTLEGKLETAQQNAEEVIKVYNDLKFEFEKLKKNSESTDLDSLEKEVSDIQINLPGLLDNNKPINSKYLQKLRRQQEMLLPIASQLAKMDSIFRDASHIHALQKQALRSNRLFTKKD